MTRGDDIILFHSPHTRSMATLVLLEELGVPYRLNLINMKRGEQQEDAYRAVNPLGKVPAILHDGALITEQVAIYIHLADHFSAAGLAPALGDARRGPYLRWLVFYAACFEPALADRALKRDPGPHMMSPYGTFDSMLGVVTGRLAEAPYLLGDTLTAADILWGAAFNWSVSFGLVPETPVIADYTRRLVGRPSFRKVAALDAGWIAEHEAAAGKTP
jgi:glutathione S-transferase